MDSFRIRDPQCEALLSCLLKRLQEDPTLTAVTTAYCASPRPWASAILYDPGDGVALGAGFPLIALYRVGGAFAPMTVDRRNCAASLGLKIILPPHKDTGAGMGLLQLYAQSIDVAAEQMFDDALCGDTLRKAGVSEAFTEWSYEIGTSASPGDQQLYPSLKGELTMTHGLRFAMPGVDAGPLTLYADLNLRGTWQNGAMVPDIDPLVQVKTPIS